MLLSAQLSLIDDGQLIVNDTPNYDHVHVNIFIRVHLWGKLYWPNYEETDRNHGSIEQAHYCESLIVRKPPRVHNV